MCSGAKKKKVLFSLFTQRETTVVLEFPRYLPDTGFITLGFNDTFTGDSLGCVPTAKLGAKTLKANFPSKCRLDEMVAK